jgi:DNA-binding HxlR family transcriptional regulator
LELQREGLVSKKIYPAIPPRVEYSLTSRAKELEVILKELGEWLGDGKLLKKRSPGQQSLLLEQFKSLRSLIER